MYTKYLAALIHTHRFNKKNYQNVFEGIYINYLHSNCIFFFNLTMFACLPNWFKITKCLTLWDSVPIFDVTRVLASLRHALFHLTKSASFGRELVSVDTVASCFFLEQRLLNWWALYNIKWLHTENVFLKVNMSFNVSETKPSVKHQVLGYFVRK